MKLWSVLLLILFTPFCQATDILLGWSPSSTPEVIGYRIYIDIHSMSGRTPWDNGSFWRIDDVGNVTTYTITNLLPGAIYYFRITAYVPPDNTKYTIKESDFSNQVWQAIDAEGLILPVEVNDFPNPEITSISVPSILQTEATITWVTAWACSGLVLWGTDESRLFAIAANNLGTTDHLARITGLTPRTHYVFKVESTCVNTIIQSKVRSFNTK